MAEPGPLTGDTMIFIQSKGVSRRYSLLSIRLKQAGSIAKGFPWFLRVGRSVVSEWYQRLRHPAMSIFMHACHML